MPLTDKARQQLAAHLVELLAPLSTSETNRIGAMLITMSRVEPDRRMELVKKVAVAVAGVEVE